jgi:hypothetical protein
MSNLSPTAADMVRAFDDCYEISALRHALFGDENWQAPCIAAVLRVVADNGEYLIDPQGMGKMAVVRVDDIMARVAELEGQ